MKFLASSLVLAAMLASTTFVAASGHDQVHAPAIRRHNHKKTCSASAGAGKKHTAHKAHKNKKSGSKKSKSGSSDSSSSSSSHDESSSESSSSSSSSHSNNSSSSSSGSSSSLNKKGGKTGLCWANSNGISIDNFLVGDVSWAYSWSDTPGWDDFPIDQLMFCPMLWGYKNEGTFKKNVVQNQNGKFNKHKCAMGMNEVNQKGQSIMSAEEGCKLMRENLMPLKDNGWYIIGPSTTNAPDGKTWYQNFQKSCPDVFKKIDAISLHYYATDADDFKKYVQDWHETFGKELWITEFACQDFSGKNSQCSKDEAWQFGQTVTKWMDTQDYVKGYAPFAVIQNLQGVSEANRLLNGNNPTSLFRMYAGAN